MELRRKEILPLLILAANISTIMGGRTLRTQVALYLDDWQVDALRLAAKQTGRTQQELLREGLDLILRKYPPPRAAPRAAKHK